MASGDVVLQITNMPVRRDSSGAGGSAVQETELGSGTTTVPGSGATIDGATGLVVRLFRSPSSPLPEALFDSTKLYKLTIEEV